MLKEKEKESEREREREREREKGEREAVKDSRKRRETPEITRVTPATNSSGTLMKVYKKKMTGKYSCGVF